jgi:glycosyltransferase involved in cell wall biosynthesis
MRTPEDEPLRVLVIAPTPYFADRGCHVRIYEEARALQARGADLLVVTYPIGRTPPGVRVRRTVRVPWYRKLEAGPSVHKPYVDALLLGSVLRAARRHRPHVFHAHLHEGASIGIAARRFTGIPVVFDIQGSLADEMAAHGKGRRGGALYRTLERVERFLYRSSDALIVNSEANRRFLAERFALPEERTVVVPDSVDCSERAPGAGSGVRERLGLGDAPVVGYLGVMTRYQGTDLLLDAWPVVRERRPDAVLLMMGFPDEPYRRRAAEMGLGDSIRFTGRVPYEEAPGYLEAVTVAVSPKHDSTEGNGKLLDYMSMGLPTVAFDTPVNREILGDDAVLVADRTADALADAIVRALDDPDGGGAGAALRKRAEERFSWDAAIGGAFEAYRIARARREARR